MQLTLPVPPQEVIKTHVHVVRYIILVVYNLLQTFNPPNQYLGGYQQLTLYHCLNHYTKQTPLTGWVSALVTVTTWCSHCLVSWAVWQSFACRFCEHCLTNTDNEQKFDIWKLPPILVIHLKRFSVSIRCLILAMCNEIQVHYFTSNTFTECMLVCM